MITSCNQICLMLLLTAIRGSVTLLLQRRPGRGGRRCGARPRTRRGARGGAIGRCHGAEGRWGQGGPGLVGTSGVGGPVAVSALEVRWGEWGEWGGDRGWMVGSVVANANAAKMFTYPSDGPCHSPPLSTTQALSFAHGNPFTDGPVCFCFLHRFPRGPDSLGVRGACCRA